MALAIRHRHVLAPALAPPPGLDVRRELDARNMATLQNRPVAVMQQRFAEGHRAYVAYLEGAPAAWGWVATRSAKIGELGATFAIPEGERYLWNFVTLPAYRGRGVYPCLLDAIVRAESSDAERFWIAYAPENRASGAGIRKAGFATIADLSFDPEGRPALRSLAPRTAAAAQLLGLPVVDDALAACWRCARSAPRGAMACTGTKCRCDYQRPDVHCTA